MSELKKDGNSQEDNMDFLDVNIKESIDRWSELILDDGVKFKVKVNVISVQKVVGKFDKNGNPIYRFKTAPIIFYENPKN